MVDSHRSLGNEICRICAENWLELG